MSTSGESDSSLGALTARYASSFEELFRQVSLEDTFTLVPVVCPSLEVAIALERFFETRGLPTKLLAPNRQSWRGLVEVLLKHLETAPGDQPPITLVYGTAPLTSAQHYALGLLNQKRDFLAHRMHAVLLWCGSEEFHAASWAAMPDLWSIRSLSFRLELTSAAEPAPRIDWGWFRPHTRSAERQIALFDLAEQQQDFQSAYRLAMQLAELDAACGRWAEAEKWWAKGMRRSELLDSRQIAAAHMLRARLLLAQGRPIEASDELERVSIDDDNLLDRVEYLRIQAGITAASTDLESADAILSEAIELASRQGLGYSHAKLLLAAADLRLRQGDAEGAKELLREAVSLSQKHADARGEAAALSALGELEAKSGERSQLRQRYQRSFSLFQETGDIVGARNVQQRLSELLGAENPADSDSTLELSLNIPPGSEMDVCGDGPESVQAMDRFTHEDWRQLTDILTYYYPSPATLARTAIDAGLMPSHFDPHEHPHQMAHKVVDEARRQGPALVRNLILETLERFPNGRYSAELSSFLKTLSD